MTPLQISSTRKAKCIPLIIVFYFFGFCHSSFGQQAIDPLKAKAIDSIKNVLKTAVDDTSKVFTLIELGKRSPNDEALITFKAALKLATKLNFRRGMASSYFRVGNRNFWGFGNYSEALENYSAALTIWKELGNRAEIAGMYHYFGLCYNGMCKYAESIKYFTIARKMYEENGQKTLVADVYSSLGVVNDNLGNLPEALNNYYNALRVATEIGDKHWEAQSYNNIGTIYRQMGNYSEALKNYFAALKIREEGNNKEALATVYLNVGNIYSDLGNYPEAIKNHGNSLKLFGETGRRFFSEYFVSEYFSIGEVYARQGNFSEALKNYQASLKVYEGLKNNIGITDCSIGLGKVFIKLNNFTAAKQYLSNALSLSKETGSKQRISEAYKSMCELDSAMGNYREALTHYRLYSDYKDSLLNETNNQLIVQLNTHYDFEKKEREIAFLNKENAYQQLLIKKQKQSKNYLVAGVVLLSILSIFAYRNYRTRQNLKLQTLRNKIASDLHDDVGSTLSSISIFSQMALEESREVRPMLQTIGESSRKMLDAMADIVWTIKPENDQFEKIIMRMRSFAYELLGARQIEFRFTADPNVANLKLSMEARRNLYLIFKEATNNMVKYANASKAMFSIEGKEDKIVMMIQDNGKGFDSNKETQGNGLKNMKKRASEMGAVLQIDSSPGSGTTIQLELAV